MECLQNWIGIRQVCAGPPPAPPRSGLYIEDYPGITKTAMQMVEPGVFLNARAWLDDLTRQAWIKIVSLDAKKVLQPYLQTKEALEFGMLGDFDEETTYMAGEAVPRGLRIEKNAGAMGVLSVPRVWVHAEDAGTFTITITDGVEPKTFEVVAVAGEVIGVWVHYTSPRDRVDVTITDALFKPANGDTSETEEFANCTTCSGSYTFSTLKARGLKGTTLSNNLQGIAVEGGITCDIEPVVCQLAPQLKVPIFYATMIQLMENWEGTARMNFFAQHKADWVSRAWTRLTQNEYPTAWELHSQGLAAFVSHLDGQCMDCGTGTHGGYGAP